MHAGCARENEEWTVMEVACCCELRMGVMALMCLKDDWMKVGWNGIRPETHEDSACQASVRLSTEGDVVWGIIN